MKKLLALLLLCIPAFGTTTFTGHIGTLGTTSVTTGSFVRFWLRGCGGNQPRVGGLTVIAPSQGAVFFFDFKANSTGVVTGTLYSNRDVTGLTAGEIECGGSHTSTWYGMQIFYAGKGGPEIPILAKNTDTFDVSNVTPLTTAPVVTAPDGDSTYARLDGGNQPFTGNLTLSGTANNACVLNGVAFVGNSAPYTACWGSSDIGAQIMAAYAASPASNGARIHVVTGSYRFTTPITFTTVNKPGLIECDPSTELNFTPAVGTAITFDWGFASNNFGHWALGGITGCWLNGNPSGNTSIGIQVGTGTNLGTTGTLIENNRITEFGNTDILVPVNTQTFMTKITNNYIGNNSANTGQTVNAISLAAGENISIVQNCLCNAQNGLFFPSNASTGSVELRNNSIDSNTVSAVTLTASGDVYVLTSIDNHYEDNLADSLDMIVWNTNLSGTTPIFNSIGDTFTNDKTTGTDAELVKCNGAQMWFESTVARSKGRTITNFATSGASCQMHFKNIALDSHIPGVISAAGLFVTEMANPAAAGLTTYAAYCVAAGCKWAVDTNGNVLQAGVTRLVETGAPTPIAGSEYIYGDSTAHAVKSCLNGAGCLSVPQVIGSGTAVMTTAAITAPACGATVTVAAAGVLTTDTITTAFSAAPAGSNAGLVAWPTANNVNFAYCPGVSETPTAATINWRVAR